MLIGPKKYLPEWAFNEALSKKMYFSFPYAFKICSNFVLIRYKNVICRDIITTLMLKTVFHSLITCQTIYITLYIQFISGFSYSKIGPKRTKQATFWLKVHICSYMNVLHIIYHYKDIFSNKNRSVLHFWFNILVLNILEKNKKTCCKGQYYWKMCQSHNLKIGPKMTRQATFWLKVHICSYINVLHIIYH